MHILRYLINLNRNMSQWFDRVFLPSEYRIDGNREYVEKLVRSYVKQGDFIYDVGGGKNPFFSPEEKKLLSLRVVGIDISEQQLSRAPTGAYDQISASDIAEVAGDSDGDIVICQAVLEHVRDTENAFRAIASLLNSGGRALIFVPCRNALFARLNNLLPQKAKERILYGIYPSTRESQGFPSFYHRCTPRDFTNLAQANGMSVEYARHYYKSSYFEFLFPVYVLWRIYQLIAKMLIGNQAAETFSMILVKRPE
jgi:SAM-dependent methyltransferase